MLAVPPLLLLPTLAFAAPVWVGDFETNDLSQFDGLLNANVNGVDYITVVQDVVAQGHTTFVLR